MARGIHVIAVFLACATVASAVLAPFPHGKATVYRYKTVAKANTEEKAIYASQFGVQGILYVTHDTRDPQLVNAYNVVLSNVTTDIHNGEISDYSKKSVLVSIDSDAKVIQEPFLIIYNPNGTFQAVKIDEHEAEWSKNMKMAMATMLQLDLPNINVENLISKPHTFVSQEKTIHGNCPVNYEVYHKDRINANVPEEIYINKTYSSMDCIGFAVHDFNNTDNENCKVTNDEPIHIDSSREFEIEKQGEGILIKKLSAYGVIRVLSPNGATYPHFIITNTTFEFLEVKEKWGHDTPLGDFINSPIIHDVTYRKSNGNYMPNVVVDVTQVGYFVRQVRLPIRLKQLLSEAVDYLEKNHLHPDKIDWNRAQAINKILRTMSYMDVDTLQSTFDYFDYVGSPRAMRIKNIFLEVVSQVGTVPSCEFTLNMIRKNRISATTAIEMLSKLPVSVKVPTTELLAQMKDLAKFDDTIPAEVRKAGIISFSSLIYRTFKHAPHSTILKMYLHDFLDHVKYEPTYEMKVVYLMAIKNIQVGKIYDLLEPIIEGSMAISKKPEHIRLLAIWAIDKAVEEDYSIALRILWPVMVNKTLPLKLRIAAYEILMNQAPDEKSALNVHEYVSNDGNEHFNNYHYTTLDSIAKSADGCKSNIREIATSILEQIPYPPKGRENIHYPLSGVYSLGHASPMYIHSEKMDIGLVYNEFTRYPEVLQHKHIVTDRYGTVSEFAIQVHMEGHLDIISSLLNHISPNRGVTLAMIRDVLEEAARSVPATKKLHIDMVLLRNGRVFIANHYSSENLENILNDLMEYYYCKMGDSYALDYQNVLFERLYERQLTTDIGVPVLVETRVPIVTSLNINYTNTDIRNLQLDMTAEFKTWEHSDYSTSVYNPMKDVWHAVHSQTVVEVSLPISMNISPDLSSKALRFSFPERPEMNSRAAGFLARGRHLVSVSEEIFQPTALKQSCDTCLREQDVYIGDKYHEKNFDFENTGLKLSTYTYYNEYGYENGYSTEFHLGYNMDWYIPFISNISNTWHELPLQVMMDIRRSWEDMVFESQMRTSGLILRLEPSTNYSISHIDVSAGGRYEDFDYNEKIFEVPHAEKITKNVTFNIVPSLTNVTARSWTFGFNVEKNRGHLTNKVSVQITRKTPDEENLNICIDAKKNYPDLPADYLKVGGTNEEIDSKLTITYGYTNDDQCVRNQSLMSVTVKAQLSDEQKKRFKYDMENSACSKDTKNPLYASPTNLVPRTINCLNEAIRYTTPRKYSVDLTHEKLTPGFASFIYRSLTDDREPRESGNLKLQAEFAMETNSFDLECMTNTSKLSKVKYDLKNIRRDGRGPVMNPLWDFPLDNSRFDLQYLQKYIVDEIRICSIYPEILLTGDGESMPFTIPSDEWTLVSGDHVDKLFAIFVKRPRPNYLSVLVFVKNHGVHIFTRESDDALVAMFDGIEPATEGDFRFPSDEDWDLRVVKRNDYFVVRLGTMPSLVLHVSPSYVSISFNSALQGHVSGLCGHLNGTSNNDKPEIYSINDITGY